MVSLDQEHYIEEVLDKFGMADCKPVRTPMNANENLSKDDCEKNTKEMEDMKNVPYQEAIGCLMCLSQSTHLMRYLRGTSMLKLEYKKNSSGGDIEAFVDADWEAHTDERKSTSGYIFLAQGGAISWCSKKQTTIALSSCEAEYMVLSTVVQEALWWQGFRDAFGYSNSIKSHCENQSLISIAKNSGYYPRTKHIDIRHHFVQETLQKGKFEIAYISTENQVADVLTKALDLQKLQKHRKSMGICDFV